MPKSCLLTPIPPPPPSSAHLGCTFSSLIFVGVVTSSSSVSERLLLPNSPSSSCFSPSGPASWFSLTEAGRENSAEERQPGHPSPSTLPLSHPPAPASSDSQVTPAPAPLLLPQRPCPTAPAPGGLRGPKAQGRERCSPELPDPSPTMSHAQSELPLGVGTAPVPQGMLLGTAFSRKLDAAVTLPSQGASSPLPAGSPASPVRGGHTSIQAAGHGVAFAGGALKEGRGAVDEGAGLACLCLRAPTVPKLGAHHQEALGGWLWGHQPRGHRGGRVSVSRSQAPWHCTPPCASTAAQAGTCLPPRKGGLEKV